VSDLLQAIFGFDALHPGEEGVRFGMTHELPLWVWTPTILFLLLLAAWSYWRLEGPVRGRAVLAAIRALLLTLVALLAAGPSLIRDNQRTERDTVAVLVDRSASLTMPDAGPDGTRDGQLRRLAADGTWAALAEQHNLLWLGFDAAPYEVAPDELGPPSGPRTRLAAAIDDALSRLAGRPISGVVLLTDGRTSDPPDARMLRELIAAKVGLYPVPLGSERPLLDLALEGTDAPASAFVGDFVPVTARVVARGGDDAAPDAKLVLTDAVTGQTLDEQPIGPDMWRDGVAEVRLAARPDDAGRARWLVRIETDGRDVLDGNNQRSVEIELVDRPLRVVYFEGYPRWEYRGVKDLLVREQSIRSSVMLLATDRRYIQEGDVALPNVPRSAGEWADFDVVILGDVRPDVFSVEQLEQLRDHVAQRGAGLVWMTGPGANPWRWATTPLADLLPVNATLPGGLRGYTASSSPVTLSPGPAASRLGVLDMADTTGAGWLASLSDPDMGWSVLRWSLAIDPGAVKATAEVLASASPTDRPTESSPSVLTMRYGAGRVVFVGTDEVWRWRYGRGESLPERFYLSLIRLAGRGSLARAGQPVLLEASPTAVGVDTPVRLGAILLDQSLVDAAPPAVEVRITRKGESTGTMIKLGPEEREAGGTTASYAASWSPGAPGDYLVEAVDPLLASANARAEFRALAPDDELRTPEADHALLAELAAQTGGAVVPPAELSRLPALLPNRSVVLEADPDVEPLWDKPVVLVLLVLLLTAEWVGRRLIRLV
jgi:hypothetical protein